MINTITTETDNYWIEGLEISTPSLSEITFTEGKFYMEYGVYNYDTDKMEKHIETDEYPAFSFDIVPDPDFDVIYDVYLLDLPSDSGQAVHVDRTEVGSEVVACYEGVDKLKYMLASILIPKGSNSLEQAEIKVYRVVKKGAENTSQQ